MYSSIKWYFKIKMYDREPFTNCNLLSWGPTVYQNMTRLDCLMIELLAAYSKRSTVRPMNVLILVTEKVGPIMSYSFPWSQPLNDFNHFSTATVALRQ